MKKIIGTAGIVLALAVGAQADIVEGDVIAVDFGSVAPTVANWNQLSTSSLTIADAIRLSDGAGTGVGVAMTLTAQNADATNNTEPTDTSLGSDDVSIYLDHSAANSTGGSGVNDLITVTYTGLDDSLTYTLTGGMARAGNGSAAWQQVYTVGGIDYEYTLVGGDTVDAYAEYTGLSSVGGVLSFTVSDYEDSGLASISQMSLEAIPEPGTLGLVAAFGGAVLFIRRRLMV
ncbi:PEP-CTERM sorting domain-containing protein [Pontiellaceae bacterium B12227]|nr:PEP-CTERM sorting domain-containing protein [Pontiellaceae bacterium B12227]